MREVLLVKVAAPLNIETMQQMREYVIESILRDVLVVDEETTLEIMEMPAVQMPVAVVEEVPKKKTDPKPEPAPETLGEREEKQNILDRLMQYREKNGLGCLSAVARKTCRKGISDNILRMLLQGDATVTIQDWRAIGKALDRLEENVDA